MFLRHFLEGSFLFLNFLMLVKTMYLSNSQKSFTNRMHNYRSTKKIVKNDSQIKLMVQGRQVFIVNKEM